MTSPAAGIAQALDSVCVSSRVAGVGVDLVEVEMLEGLLASDRAAFLNIGWTEVEQRNAEGIPERLAARWAVKEAVMKALGQGLGDVDPLDIEVARGLSGAPEVRLRGSAERAAEQAGVGSVHVSMSHEQGWAVGFAVAGSRSVERCLEIHNHEQDMGDTNDG